MTETEPIRRTVTVKNPAGLHLRPAAALARCAQSFSAVVTIWNGARRADGKSPLSLIGLVALPGVELVVETTGADDAQAAADMVCALLADPGDGE